MNFDDNAEYRQGDIFKMDDLSETDPREVEAAQHHLNYIGMEGNIGCMGRRNVLILFNQTTNKAVCLEIFFKEFSISCLEHISQVFISCEIAFLTMLSRSEKICGI